MGLLDHGAADHGSVLKHVLQIHQIAVVHVLGKIIGIVEMNQSLIVGGYNVVGKKNPLGDILAYLTGHVVTLHAVDRGILVGVLLLDFFIVAFNQA